ncbi:MAG TPA: holo-ACP synthase [Acidobacteriota bacterium]|nr:holo-ACP synthase [Acidobacteriota bacterium]
MILGIGTDVIEVSRIRQALDKYGERFMRRLFTAAEIEYCTSRKNTALHYAGRFAAKEAAFKAMQRGWGGEISWKDVEITNLPSGAPQITFSGKALEIVTEKKMTRAFVSISHVEEIATAIVILESE